MKPHEAPVAIVTGGGKRLGRRIALALGGAGYDVVVNYRSSAAGARAVVREIIEGGRGAIAVRGDVSRSADVRRLVRTSLRHFGHIDLLVNNAAIFITKPLLAVKESEWSRTIDINLKGTFLCAQAVAPAMLKQKSGKIINIASLGGLQPWKEHAPYSVAKAGVVMLTKVLAKSLAPHVAVNAVAPGTILLRGEERLPHVPRKSILLGRYGAPSDITGLILYLATTASYITGQVIPVDGGRSIQ